MLQARMKNPAFLVPGALDALYALGGATARGGVPLRTRLLVELRASQINGCSLCVEMHARELRKAKESDERIFGVAAWRESPHYGDAERAALALTEAVTRLADRPEPVPDALWEEAKRHYDDEALASLVLGIALVNLWNRLNATTRQVAGTEPR